LQHKYLKESMMLKFYLQILFFFFIAVYFNFTFSYAAEPTVSVSISPNSQTVKVKANGVAEEIGKNTAKYTISASCDPSSLETEEVKPVNPSWTCSCSEITFVPPKNVQPAPESQGNPNVSALEGTNSWTTKVSAPYAGRWKLKFTASVTYDVWDKKKEDYVLNEDGSRAKFGPYSGSGTCTFIATSKPWKVELSTDNIIVRRATNPQQKIVPFKKVTAKLIDADSQKTVIFSSNGVGELRFGMSANAEDVWNTTQQSLTITIPKDGTKEFYVSGEKESASMNDASIVVTSTDSNPEVVGSTQMTVLWVTMKGIKQSGKLSDKNSAKPYILNKYWGSESGDINALGPQCLINKNALNVIESFRCGFMLEIHATVKPVDFAQDVEIVRDVEGSYCSNLTPTYTLVLEKQFNPELGQLPVNDTTKIDEVRDKKAEDIFDFDWP
jgi:hypothetical protein